MGVVDPGEGRLVLEGAVGKLAVGLGGEVEDDFADITVNGE